MCQHSAQSTKRQQKTRFGPLLAIWDGLTQVAWLCGRQAKTASSRHQEICNDTGLLNFIALHGNHLLNAREVLSVLRQSAIFQVVFVRRFVSRFFKSAAVIVIVTSEGCAAPCQNNNPPIAPPEHTFSVSTSNSNGIGRYCAHRV
ncbi:MAG: hypothetical protein KGP14_05795 [Betaproteobacteria bacterium]|nr:hypothetical protein [Betaproteobacteria bacterium]